MTDPRRLAGFGGALLGASSAAARLGDDDARVRTPLAVSRRLGFVAVGGGCGTSSAVAAVGSLLAHRRAGMVLAVDAAGGRAGLAPRLALTAADDADHPNHPDQAGNGAPAGTETAPEAAAVRRTARTAAEARYGLPRSPTGVHLLDLAGPDRLRTFDQGWRGQVGPVARFFDLVLTDWGARVTEETASIASTGQLTVVIGRGAPASAAAAAERAASVTGGPTAVLLVDVSGDGAPTASGLRAELARPGPGQHPVPLLVLPFDRELARAGAPVSRRYAGRTRTAHLALAATLVELVALTPPVRPPARRVDRGWAGDADRTGRVVMS